MRAIFAVTAAALLAGCAGHVADFVGPRDAIVTPQLARYGLDSGQTQCVGNALAAALDPRQLRLFTRRMSGVTQGYFEPGRLTPRDLSHIASHAADPAVGRALVSAYEACGVTAQVIAELAPTLPESTETLGLTPTGGLTGVRRVASPTAIWLNLGAAPTGQAIAVDAASIEQRQDARSGWFRLTDPGAAAPAPVSYRLELDCAARTIRQQGLRRHGESEAVEEPREEPPVPIESGTVMEIAYLALCT